MMTFTVMPKYEEYKDSGVEWLGRIPTDWDVKRFKHLYVSAMGETILASNLVTNGSIPVYSATEGNHYFGFVDKCSVILNFGDLVIPARGNSIGYPKLVAEKSTCSQTTIYAKKKGNIHEKFTYYYLVGCKPYLFQFVQTAIPQITVDEIKNNILVYPAINEQTAIVNFLDEKTAKIDEAIAIKEKQIELLKERKQIIIQQAVTQGLDPTVPMKDSGVEWIGRIPAHWEVKRLKYVLDERSERSITGEEPLFMMSQQYGLVVRADYHDKAVVSASSVDNKIVYENDLVFNKLKAHLGVFFKSNIKFKGIVSPDYAVYKTKAYIVDTKILELLFRHPLYIEQFIIRATGIVEGLIRLYTSDLFDISIPVAPATEQLEILEFIERQSIEFDKAIEIQESQCEKLKEYKTTLINSAVTGKIKVV